MNFGQLFFGFSGRINRGKYWLAALVFLIINLVMAILGYASDQMLAFQVLNVIVSLGTVIAGIAVGIKRLHDRDKSGWWLLVFYLVPGILVGIGSVFFLYGLGDEAAGSIIAGSVVSILGLAVMVWAFVELGCLRGTLGPNRFGSDPLVAT
jgi:uncharacterized membrane protein YhaH (DUF805 family)